MTQNTIKTELNEGFLTVILNREEKKNAINFDLLQEINQALDFVEQERQIKAVVFKANGPVFSSGFDLSLLRLLASKNDEKRFRELSSLYLSTLRRFSTYPKYIVSILEEKVLAGGVGLVSASDIVIAKTGASFSLPEVLWGLFPFMVLLYLEKRIGRQKSLQMAAGAQTIFAKEAFSIGLADQVDDCPKKALGACLLRLSALNVDTVASVKSYTNKLSPVDESLERFAIEESMRLFFDPKVQERIQSYLETGNLPWKSY